MAINFGKQALIIVIGLVCLTWQPTVAYAQLDQAQLRNLVSGLDMLRDRLAYQRSLLDPDLAGKYPQTNPDSFFSVPGEVELALEYLLFAATADDRAKVESFILTCKRLDSYTKAYAKTVQIEKFEMNDAFHREKFRAFLRDNFPDLPEKNHVSPMETKARPPSGPPQKWVLDCGKPNCISGKIELEGDGGPFPSYAQAPPSTQASSVPKKAKPTPDEDLRPAWADLDLQYIAALDQVDELRKHFLKQLSSE